ncbi:unnamed protein product [Caenorhabditis nigoni]
MAGVFSKVLEFMGFEERSSSQKTPNPASKDPKFYPRKCLKTGNSILITQVANGRIRIFEFLENSENGFQNHEQCPTCKEYIYVHEEKAKSEDVQKTYSEAIEKVPEDVEIQKSDDVEDSEMASDDVKESEDVKKLQNPEKPYTKKFLLYESLSESDVSESELLESDFSDSENIEFLIRKSRLTEEAETQKKLVQKILESANRGNWYEDVKEDSDDVENPEWASEDAEDVKDSEEDVEDSEGSSEDDWSSEDDTQWEDSDSEDVEAPGDVQASAEDVEASKKDEQDSEDVKMYYAFNRREEDFLKKLNDFRRASLIASMENYGVFTNSEDVKKSEDVKDSKINAEASDDVKNPEEVAKESENEWALEDDTQWEESDSEDVQKDDSWTTNLQETIRKLKSPKTDSEVDDDVTRDSSEVVRKFRNLMNEIHEENQKRNEELMKIFK